MSLGLYSIAYHSDKSEGYWINKIDQLLPEPFYPQEGINSSFIKPDQSINYKLKIINALDKINRNIFEQSKLQGWVNDLSRFGTPKEQIELFKEIVKDGMSKDEIISSLLATYDFAVEINTATTPNNLKINSTTRTFNFNNFTYEIDEYDDQISYTKMGYVGDQWTEIKITKNEYIKKQRTILILQ